MISKEFTQAKEHAMQKLHQALKSNQVDTTIIPILRKINQYPNYFTTSSCAGRIQLLELPQIGDKKNAKILGKWHITITPTILTTAITSASKGMIWMLAQSPIIHITTTSYQEADNLLKKAIQAGFKNSGIKPQGKHIHLELCSTERLDAPIGADGALFGSSDYIKLLVKISNDIIIKSINKIDQLLISL
jgi:tRNA wybutosine-synthesizing protein 3